MTSDEDTPRVVNDVSDDVLAAVAIIQLLVQRLPDDKLILEVAAEHSDSRHRQVTGLLRNANRVGVDDHILIRFSALIHLSCEWAWHYRQSNKTGIIKTKTGWRIRTRYRTSSSSRELRRLAGASCGDENISLAKAIADLSPHTFGELRIGAKELGIVFTGPASLLCRECILKASNRALINLNTGRPQLREMDRATRAVKLAYQTVTGRSGSGRGTTSEASADAGRPTGELHSLLLKIGSIYDLKLVTAASDGRLRKLAKSGVNTTSK